MIDWKKLSEQQQETQSPSKDELQKRVVEMLRTIYDPEMPVNIYDLGLVYSLDVEPSGLVNVRMTLTAPNCPVAQSFPQNVQETLMCVPGVRDVKVALVWEPLWSKDRMTESAKLALRML